MIADSPDATHVTLACAWCEQPLRAAIPGSTAPLRCAVCGSRTGAWPSDEQLARLVASARADAGAGDAGDAARADHRCSVAELLRRRARRRLAHRVAVMAPPGPVLDVGSGDGTLLDALRGAGRVATGVGRSPARTGVCDVDITELGGRYAAIVFWQSLGRVRAPRAALEHAAALLKPDGLLTIAQPTSVGLPALTERLRGGEPASPRVKIPQRALVERLHALGLEVLYADRVRERSGLAGWSATLLGGVVSVEARR
ncbi:class I SAM-dependent methyltransferase [Conexibacter woesei]|uniref:class I SAM-dependent methyltransferase n=1 Tax=Conexibacter woesei TaxID=191495 RepID=UPI0005A1940D|nr:class I SAM-dependent methyltransferase [Conexibacter woesei]